MILFLPLEDSPGPLQLERGHPCIWWAVQSYEKLASLVLALVFPQHLAAGIQVHMPRSTGFIIVPPSVSGFGPQCLLARKLLDTEEEVLIAAPEIAFQPEGVRNALAQWRTSPARLGYTQSHGIVWWRAGRDFVKTLDEMATTADWPTCLHNVVPVTVEIPRRWQV